MTKHTPGPWQVAGGIGPKDERYVWSNRNEKGKSYIGSHEVCIAVVKGKRFNEGQDCTLEEIYLADAALIAAAPDLARMCERLLDLCRWKCSPTDEDGAANHQTLIAACELLARVKGTL